jgi:REP element-mobilizing transposase RayT
MKQSRFDNHIKGLVLSCSKIIAKCFTLWLCRVHSMHHKYRINNIFFIESFWCVKRTYSVIRKNKPCRIIDVPRRANTKGGTYFFTVVTLRRQKILCDELVRNALRTGIKNVQSTNPFTIDAWVLLPDHLHCIWTLPPNV